MKNSDYWKQRFEQLEDAQHQMGVDTFSEIEKQYRQAQKAIEGQISSWYQRFAKNNGITMAEARTWLTGADLKEFKWDVQEYIKYGQDNALTGGWMKELENASAKFHISKLEALKVHTQHILESLFSSQIATAQSGMGAIFESGYYHTAYELQKGFNIGFDIAGIDQKQLEQILSKPWAVDGYNFSERIWKNKQKMISEVHAQLTQNVLLGDDPQVAIDAIAKKLNTSKSNAGRLVLTEEAYFSSRSQGDCFRELDVEQFEIVATLDSHTSEICRSLDGKVFPMKDYEAGVTAPPFHPWCRSTTVPAFDEDFGQIGERAARDEETGKTYYIPDDIAYQEWEDTFVKGGDKSGYTVFDDGSTLHYKHDTPEPTVEPPKPKKEYLTKKKLQANIANADAEIEELQQKIAEAFEYPSYDEIIKDFGSIENAGSGIEEAHTIVQGKKEMEALEKKYGGDISDFWDKATTAEQDAYGEWDQKVWDASEILNKNGQSLDSWGSEAEIEQLYSEYQEAKSYQTQIEQLAAQKAEWEEKLKEKLVKEQKKALAKQQLDLEVQKAAIQQQLDDFEIKTYSGIWKGDVTTADFASLNIEGKKKYYEGKFITETDPDLMAKYQDLYKQLSELETEGKAYADIQAEMKKIEQELKKVQSDLQKLENGGIMDVVDDTFSQERKDAAYWFTDKNGGVAAADAVLRDKSGEVWRAATTVEKDSIYDYTSSYHKFNEPLRGIEYGTNKYLGVGNVDLDKIGVSGYGGFKPGEVHKEIDAVTSIIEKSSYDFDIWVQRGCRYDGMDKFFNIDMYDLQNLSESELAARLVGTTPTEYAFMSTGVSKGKGLNVSGSGITLNIYAPKGTKMMYAEPFSAFGNGDRRSWDGISKQKYFGDEAEMLMQRGTKFRVLKVEKKGNRLYFDLEVIEQGVY